jgi:hypothetical protein
LLAVTIEISFYKFITLLKCFKILVKIYLKEIGERNRLENPVVDWRITLRCIFRTCDGGHEMDWSYRNRDSWRALVNAVMNFRVPQNAGISCLAE